MSTAARWEDTLPELPKMLREASEAKQKRFEAQRAARREETKHLRHDYREKADA